MMRRNWFLGIVLVVAASGVMYAHDDSSQWKVGLSDDQMRFVADETTILSLLKEGKLQQACEYICDCVQQHPEILPDQRYEAERIGNNIMCLATFLGHDRVVVSLLAQGFQPDIATYFGTTPLFYAVARGYTEIAELLLAYGADAHSINRYGETLQELVKKSSDNRMRVLFAMYTDLERNT